MKALREFLSWYPLDPRGKSQKHRRVLLALTCAALLCAACCLGVLSLLYGSLYFIRARLLSYFQYPMLVFLNWLPIVLAAFFLYFLTNRAWLAFLTTAVLVMAGAIGNYYMVVLRDDVLVFEDLASIGAAAGILGEYDLQLSDWFKRGITASALGTVFLFLVCRGRLPDWRWRAGGAALLAALAVGSYFLWYASDERYERFENYELFNRWQPTEKSASRGFIYPFVHSIEEVRGGAPEGYSKQTARALLEEYPEGEIPAAERVDVIAVMLESFADFSALEGVEFTADPYAPLREIWAESLYGTLIVDTMGGGTVNAERGFLTGYTYPHPSYSRDTESFVRYFARQGYATEGSHPGHDWFYNRKSVNESLGLETFYFMENLYSQFTDEEYAMDDLFFPRMRALYDQRDPERPYFAFHISYQNHSPYEASGMTGEYVARDGLSEGAYTTVNSYLSGVADTAARAAAFIEGFRDEAGPVILVFFGDHKPTLGGGNRFYGELGVNMNRADLSGGFANYYSTPYWIWMNDAAREALSVDPAGTGPTISPCYLMPVLFDLCGWQGSPYLNFLKEAVETLPVVQSTDVYLEDGRFTANISENSQMLLEKLSVMEYYLRRTTYKS